MASAESVVLADQKRALRQIMGDTRSRLPAEERTRASERLSARLAGLPELGAAAARGAGVAGFVAVRGEIDPAAALAAARRAGARVALPRVAAEAAAAGAAATVAVSADTDTDTDSDGSSDEDDDDGQSARSAGPRLRFHVADGATAGLRPGRFGIPEPPDSSPELAGTDVAVMLVPGLAFDARGNRLGFGGGFYDEWLTSRGTHRPALVVGVGYDFQVVDACPVNDRDARVDCVVTDARVIRCADGGGDGAGSSLPLSTSSDDGKVAP